MKKIKLEAHFYNLYGRLGEGVIYDYEVEYDWDSIMKNNINPDNFKFIPIGINSSYDSYFKRYSIDKTNWDKEMLSYLKKSGESEETFFENLPQEQYDEYESKWLK